MKKLFKLAVMFMAAAAVVACKDDPTPDPVQPDKPTNPGWKAGNLRGEITFTVSSTEPVKEAKIFWNNKADSETVAVTGTTVTKIITGLTEGNHTFEIFAYSDKGIESEAATVTGKVYGATYKAGLKGLTVESASLSGDGVLFTLKDVPTGTDFVGLEVEYTDLDGEAAKKLIAAADLGDRCKLAGVKTDTSLTYRSVFQPEANAIDKFSTADATIAANDIGPRTVVDVKKPYSNFYVADFDASQQTEAYCAMSYAWDGLCLRDIENQTQAYDAVTGEKKEGVTTKYYASAQQVPGSNTLQPIWNTFDIGEYAKVANIHIHYGMAFEGSYPREYELWALDDPIAEPTNNWTNWVKLGGGGSGDKGALDKESATAAKDLYFAGQETKVDYADAPLARYYRFKCTKGGTWEFGYQIYNYYMYTISEITFYKYDEGDDE